MTMTQANGEMLMSGMESPVAAGTARRKALGTMLVRLGAVGTFAIILVYFALMAPGFLNFYNILNVVEQSAAVDDPEASFRQPELLAEPVGVAGDPLAVTAGVGVLRLDGVRQRGDGGQVGVLEILP